MSCYCKSRNVLDLSTVILLPPPFLFHTAGTLRLAGRHQAGENEEEDRYVRRTNTEI